MTCFEWLDGMVLRYGLDNLLEGAHVCDGSGCGQALSIEHGLHCPYGALPTQRHNAIQSWFLGTWKEAGLGVGAPEPYINGDNHIRGGQPQQEDRPEGNTPEEPSPEDTRAKRADLLIRWNEGDVRHEYMNIAVINTHSPVRMNHMTPGSALQHRATRK